MKNFVTPILILIAVLQSSSGRSATVTSTADSGLGSLREAIANAVPGETIQFSTGDTITLTSGELAIDKDLIISGPGASNLLIQRSTAAGTLDFRIFTISPAHTVVISGLTVSNGRVDVGGGIYNDGDLMLNDCVISGNFATESGGGMANLSSLTLNNCVIRNNSAAGETGDGFGGGFYNAGTAGATDCIITNNSVTSATDGGFGGGIYNDGTLTLSAALIKNNSATGGPDNGGGFGGGINNGFGTLYVNDSTVSGNIARGGAGSYGGLAQAGGVANGFGTVTLDRSTVSGNSTVGGNGSSGGSGEGGGIANDAGTVYVYSSTVSGNVSNGGSGTTGPAPSYGGGIYNALGSVIATHSTVAANVVPGGLPKDGGGIFNDMGGLELRGTIVAANTGTVDLFNSEFADILLDGYTISHGFNLVGSASGLIFPAPGDQFDVTAAALKLGSLQNNGGPTFTHALLCGSPALNTGDSDDTDAPATDQRGFARIVGSRIDIGAFEASNALPTISSLEPTTWVCATASETAATFSVDVSDAEGDPLVVVWTVDGTAYQTNLVAAAGPLATEQVDFTTLFGIGTHQLTVSVSDPDGCPAIASTTVEVGVSRPLTVNCPAVPDASTDGNCQAAVPDILSLVSVGAGCAGNITLSQSPAAGTWVGLGAHKITVTATDGAGNSASCTTTFTVADTTPPTVVCPAPSTASAGVNCQAPVPNVLGGVTVSDNCSSSAAITLTQSPSAGTLVGLGTHTITVTATDAAGNSGTCTTTFTVADITPPTVICPAPSTASAGVNCQAPVPNVLGGVTVSDNCSSSAAITLTQSPSAGTLVGLGPHTITVTATDAAGNSGTCTTTFTVKDTTPPTVICPAPSTASAGVNCQAPVPNVLGGVTVSDNCSSSAAITLTQNPSAGTLVGLGPHTITVTATDAAGNSGTCTTSFTVQGLGITIVTLTDNTDNDIPTGPHIEAGRSVTWTYLVTNSGCESLENVTVSDSVTGVLPIFQSGDANTNSLLDVGEAWIYAATNTAGFGQYENIGTATARGYASHTLVTSSNPDHYFGDPTPCPAGTFSYSIDPVTGDVNIRFTQFPAPNDNSYGTNAVGWEKGHIFKDLVQSDHAGFQLRDASGAVKLDFYIDYLSAKLGTPSGYGSLGPFGGDGGIVKGTLTPADIVFDTSMGRNLNNLGYFVGGVQTAASLTGTNGADLLLNSPPTLNTNTSYTLKAPHPWTKGWDFNNSYFVTIKKAKLDSLGFNAATWVVEPDGTGLHNSPAKPCLGGLNQYTPVTGGEVISADGAVTGAFTTLTGPTFTEIIAGEVGTGTIIIVAPTGFIFDTGGTPPTVSSVKIGGDAGNSPVQGSVTSVTTNQITYTVTAASANASLLTWQNIRVRPTSGTPLASGYLTRSGTASVAGLPNGAILGTLFELAGAPGNLAIVTQPSATAMAGVPFPQQPAIEVRDQFGNLRTSDNTTVVTAARLAGSGTLQGMTSIMAAYGVVTFTNLSHNVATNITLQFTSPGVTPSASDPIAVSGGTVSQLAFTTQPGNASAGSAFGIQPVLRTLDAFGNYSSAGLPASRNVTVILSSGTGPLQGTSTLDIGKAAGNGTALFTNLRIDSVGSGKQLTASASGFTSAVSAPFTVSAGPAASLAIQTQPPATATAGVALSPAPVVRLLDAVGNLCSSDNTTVVTATRNAGTASLQGTTSVTAVNGVATFSSLSYNKAETMTIRFSSGTLTGATSSSVTVSPGAASKLTISTQPSSTATAGATFAQQPVIRVEDAFGNFRSSDNSTVVTVARNAGTGTLQGTLTATAVNGFVTFANLSHNVADTINLNFTATGLTGATSGNIVVRPAAFAKLQLLVPGEIAAPGSASGKTGTPTAPAAGAAFSVTVNAVDAFWNTVNTITDTVSIASSDSNADLPANVALVSGTRSLSVTFKTGGSQTLTASDLTNNTKTANTSPPITVNAGAFVKLQLLVPGETAAPGTATGKTGTPMAQSAGTAFNVTVNAVDANWNVASSAHTVGITTTDPNDTHPANAALSSGTATFVVTTTTAGSWTLTATDITDGTKTANTSPFITVNPGAFAKLQVLVPGETAVPGSATGKTGMPAAQTVVVPFNVAVKAVDANWNPITNVTDTVGITSSDLNAVLPANAALVAGSQSFSVTLKTAGSPTVTATDLTDGSKTPNTSSAFTANPGPFVKMQLLVPGETAAPGTATGKTGSPSARTAGKAFNVTVNAVDANWNVASSIHTVGITSSESSATLPANAALSAGTRTFSVTLNTPGPHTLTATDITDGTKTANTSPPIPVNVGPADKLTIQTQPSANPTAGVPFAQQPVIRVEDSVGNLVTTDNGRVITVARSAGTGTLQGTLTATTVNGVATFANLSHNVANTINLSFTASRLTGATSSNVVVKPAAFVRLQLLVPGETAAPGSASGKTGSPTARSAGTSFSVTVNGVDGFWNVVNTVTHTVRITSSDTNGDLPANLALVSGTQSLSVTLKTAGSQTLTASDLTDATKTANTSPSMTVNAGAFAKLQLLVPGETAAPGSATGKTGTPTVQSAGTSFNVTVKAVDAIWNPVSSTDTVGITTTDPNDTHPANAALSAGSATFAVTLRTAGAQTVTATDISDGTKTANTSLSITVNPAAFTKLQILLPGETAAPGSATGKTGTPAAQTVGTPFNVTVNAVDANWNTVTTVTDTVGITSSDANASLPANTALVSGTQTLSVTLKTAGTRTLTASDLTNGSKTANTSPAISVNAGAFVKLQLLVPGETAAPGTATGKTGSPTDRTADSAFNITINAVDANWNVVSSTHTVQITSSDSNAILPANGVLSAGTRTFSVNLRTAGSQTVMATDIIDNTKTADTSLPITVNVGAASKLTIQTQPSPSAMAGVPFAQQPVIRVEDSAGNLVTTDNGRVITAARSAGAGTLQGTVTATTVNGVATFANLSHNVAGTIRINFTTTGLTTSTSGDILVSPAAFAKLQLLVPGETAAPGTATGKTGTPTAKPAGADVIVTVNAVDALWNRVSAVTDLVGITSTDTTALLPMNSALVSGTTTLSLIFNTNGSFTITASDLSDGGIAPSTSPAIAVSPAQFTPATGGGAIAADGATSGAFTSLSGPSYTESATGDVGLGTIILTAPTGFLFDTGGTAPTVLITRVKGSGNSGKNINGVSSGTVVAMTSVTSSQLVFTVTSSSESGIACKLTWQNIRVRPSAGTPLATGNLTRMGTAIVVGLSSNSNLGTLREVAGAASSLAIQTQPSSTATAGVAFAQQPVVHVLDQFGNLRSAANGTADNSALVNAVRGIGSGTLQGTTSLTAVDGVVKFTNLSHNVAMNITIQFTSPGTTPSTSTSIAVSGGSVSQLAFVTQPGNATAGSAFGIQPVVQAQDAFGNNTTEGLPASLPLTVSLSSGSGSLRGTRTLDIGTAAGKGTAVFIDLRIDSAGTGKQLTASASGLISVVSAAFTVNSGPAAGLAIQTQPPATVSAGTVFSPAPVIRIVDAFGNLRSSDSSTVITATRNLGSASLLGTTSVTALNGVATFSNLSYNKAETFTIDFASAGLPGVTSTSVTASAGAASKLVIQTQPSSTGSAGVTFAQQPVIRVEDSAGNLITADNGRVITVARSAGTGTLQGTLTATTLNGVATFANLTHNVANTINLNFTATGLTGATSDNIVVSPAAFTKIQLFVPGETTAPGSASGKTGTPSATTAGTPFNVTVRAVDAFWNLVSTATDTVAITASDASADLPANAALVSGTQNISVTLKTAGTATLTSSDLTDSLIGPSTSPSITVNTGAFAKLQLLVPGETAAPGSATGKTGTPTAQSAGTSFNVSVKAVDANWNPVSSTDTVGITTSDPNDTHPINAALSAGNATFAVTFKSAGSWTVTATDITDGTKTANTSPSVTVNAGAFTRLQILVPGETAAPGSATGKTGTPTAPTAGTPFNVTVNAVDANWNTVTTVADTVGITSSDANAGLPGNTALVSGTKTLSVTFKTVGTRTLTASDSTDGTKLPNTSPSITVSVGAFVKLQVLMPGETAAPGTASGKTGTPTAQPTGTAFNVTVNAVDANWNLVSSAHTVGLTSSDSNATLPVSGALSSGTRTASVTLKTVGAQTVTATDITDGTKIANTSSPISVSAGAANKLTIQTQPSPSATAGVPFAQQPVIRVEDANGNLVSADNGRLITVARSAGTGTLQGTLTATTVNGVVSFANLSHNVANTIALSFTATGLTSATSASIVVSPATASQLVFTTQPSGTRTGSPLATQPAIKALDAYGNTSSVGLPANLNVSLALTSGSGSLMGTTSLDIGSAGGNGTAIFTTVECSDAGTNKQITASATGFTDAISSLFTLAGVERATGGTAIPSSTASGAYTTLTGPVYYEYASGDVGTGTIILNAPSGFVFDTSGTAPTVRIDRLAGIGNDNRNINGVATGTSAAITSRTTTQITFTVSGTSSLGVTCSLTWQNVRVRPTVASPLASGNMTKTGTSTMAAVTTGSTSFGRLIETGSIGPASYRSAALPTEPPVNLTGINSVPGGIKITFTGSAGYTYQIHRAAVLQNGNANWVQVGSATTDAEGLGEFTDLNPTVGQGYYRTTVEDSQNGLLDR